MGETSKIQWTDATWNIARGCTKINDDCKFCYMYRQSLNGTRYDAKKVIRTKTVFNLPLKLKIPSKIFTSSLTDFFHPDIDSYRDEAWDIIRKCPQHTFQILTKRPERILDHLPSDWGEGWDNVWLGTSVGSPSSIERVFYIIDAPSKVRFLSIEPLYEAIDLEYPKELFPNGPQMCCNGTNCGCLGKPIEPPIVFEFDWVIVGGESGNEKGKYRYRECKLEWIESIINQCVLYKVPVFVKQLGTHLSKQLKLKDRHGGEISEWPKHLQIRQMPNGTN